MTARDPRFEVVRTDAGWHARFLAANGQTVWTTESYRRRNAAERAVELIAGAPLDVTPHNEHRETFWQGNLQRPTEVRAIDERTQPPAPLVAEPPFYLTDHPPIRSTERMWHDRDYHWRNCYGDECSEGTPPPRAQVHVHGGMVMQP